MDQCWSKSSQKIWVPYSLQLKVSLRGSTCFFISWDNLLSVFELNGTQDWLCQTCVFTIFAITKPANWCANHFYKNMNGFPVVWACAVRKKYCLPSRSWHGMVRKSVITFRAVISKKMILKWFWCSSSKYMIFSTLKKDDIKIIKKCQGIGIGHNRCLL